MKKLLVCDVEGTIFKAKIKIEGTDFESTMWQSIADSLGQPAIEEELATHKKWENKEYDHYINWVEATVHIHQKYGLQKDKFYSLIDSAEYIDGVVEFFEELDRNIYIPVLISGGFEELIKRAMCELKIHFGFGACEYFFDKKDGTISGYKLNPSDFQDKYHYVEKLFKHYKVNAKEDWIYIGDGKNDVDIAKRAPLTFGINAHPELSKIVDHNCDTFHQIRTLLNQPIKTSTYQSYEEKLLLKIKSLKTEIKKLKKLAKDPTKREKKLSNENFNLRNEIRELKQKQNENKDDLIDLEIIVKSSDYITEPTISLQSILNDGYKIAFFGFREDDQQYKYFYHFHKNMRMYSGFDKAFDVKPIKHYDFYFLHIDFMSHTVSDKISKFRNIVPYSRLKIHTNIDKIKRAIANILIREFKPIS